MFFTKCFFKHFLFCFFFVQRSKRMAPVRRGRFVSSSSWPGLITECLSTRPPSWPSYAGRKPAILQTADPWWSTAGRKPPTLNQGFSPELISKLRLVACKLTTPSGPQIHYSTLRCTVSRHGNLSPSPQGSWAGARISGKLSLSLSVLVWAGPAASS